MPLKRMKLAKKSKPKSEQKSAGAASSAPVTNKTVEEHRSEIIGKARKYIYPTRTKRHIVVVSTSIILAAIVIFLVVCGFLLYKFQNTSTFIYRVTQIVPFPVARADGHFVSYENYLFEIRHYTHYYHYRNQQPVDFSSQSGQDQLNHYKHQALSQVVDYAYAKQLAQQHNISVTSQEVDQKLNDIRERGLLGRSEQQLQEVLEQTFGWSLSDYRRELAQELLLQKISSVLDVSAHQKAQLVLNDLGHGTSFADLAAKYSDDKSTAGNGGQYPELITDKTTDLPPELVAAAFSLKPGQTSGVIDTGYSLEIIQLVAQKGDQLQLAHIQINLEPASYYIKPLEQKSPPTYYITLPKA